MSLLSENEPICLSSLLTKAIQLLSSFAKYCGATVTGLAPRIMGIRPAIAMFVATVSRQGPQLIEEPRVNRSTVGSIISKWWQKEKKEKWALPLPPQSMYAVKLLHWLPMLTDHNHDLRYRPAFQHFPLKSNLTEIFSTKSCRLH